MCDIVTRLIFILLIKRIHSSQTIGMIDGKNGTYLTRQQILKFALARQWDGHSRDGHDNQPKT